MLKSGDVARASRTFCRIACNLEVGELVGSYLSDSRNEGTIKP